MDDILEQQRMNRISVSDMQLEQLFEVETVLKQIKTSIDVGIVELFSLIDDSVKSIEKTLVKSSSLSDTAPLQKSIDEGIETLTESIGSLKDSLDSNVTRIVDSLEKTTKHISDDLIPFRRRDTSKQFHQTGYIQTREDFLESQKLMGDQTSLLQRIADNTEGMNLQEDKKEENHGANSFIGALLGSGFFGKFAKSFKAGLMAIFSTAAITGALKSAFSGGKIAELFGKSGLMGTLSAALKSVFSMKAMIPIMLLGKGILKILLAPLTLIVGTIRAAYDAVADYSENGDIIGAVKMFFGSLVNWLSFGIIGKDFGLNQDSWIAEKLLELGSWIKDGISSAISSLMSMSTEEVYNAYMDYIARPFWNGLKNLGKFLVNDLLGVLSNFFETAKNLHEEYIKKPIIEGIKSFVKWVFGGGLTESIKDLTSLMGNSIDPLKFLYMKLIAEPLWKSVETLGSIVRENLIDPVIESFSGIGDFVRDLKDKIIGMFENFQIPKVSFIIPVIDKEVSIGPWFPFKSEKKAVPGPSSMPGRAGAFSSSVPEQSETNASFHDITLSRMFPDKEGRAEARRQFEKGMGLDKRPLKSMEFTEDYIEFNKALKPAEPNISNTLYNKSKEAEESKRTVIMPSTNVVAPSTTNNVTNTTNNIRAPIKNSDSSLSSYLAKWFS